MFCGEVRYVRGIGPGEFDLPIRADRTVDHEVDLTVMRTLLEISREDRLAAGIELGA